MCNILRSILFFVGIICSCSVCAVLLHLFSVARVPLAALFFSLLLVFLLGGSAGAGASLLAPLPSLCAKVTKSSSMQACAGLL